jgi:dipeptidyl aminopeptidase/acylaminoacyl peptidase
MRDRRILAAAVSLAVLGSLSAQAPVAAGTGAGGLIAYDRQSSLDDIDVWVMNADGTDQRPLTQGDGVINAQPDWSPDGTRLAFISNRTTAQNADGNLEIFVMDADGSSVLQVTNTVSRFDTFPPAFNQYEPAWSPDGSRIAFEAVREAGTNEILTIVPDGSGEVQLTDESDRANKFAPEWSPNGARIAYTWSLGQGDVHVMSADGSDDTKLTPGTLDSDEGGSAWSPDGARIAFVTDRHHQAGELHVNPEIYVMDPDGSNLQRLTENPAYDLDPEWSPDGTEISFTSDRDGPYDIYSMPFPPAARTIAARTSEDGIVRLTATAADEGSTSWRSRPVCTVVGTDEGEVLLGTAGEDIICGRGGDDIIRAFEGNDQVRGGGGNDVLRGLAGADIVRGNVGADLLRGGRGDDSFDGGNGVDSCVQGTGAGSRSSCERSD